MSNVNPTRAALLELQEERHAMREGHVFLDEKCLLLAGEMLRQLQQHGQLQKQLDSAYEAALGALHAALARDGLESLQQQPVSVSKPATLELQAIALMGVRLLQAQVSDSTGVQEGKPVRAAKEPAGAEEVSVRAEPVEAPASPSTSSGRTGGEAGPSTGSGRTGVGAESLNTSPELRACRQAFARLIELTAPLAAVSGNLERLSQEYRRSVRRARALQDVLLPALERDVADIQTRLEELEQQDAIAMRR
jgi:V/A-type H+/Na+-transporting ATPase subunit D